MKLILYKDKKSEYRWKLVAANGNTVADSGEGYTTLSNARRAARSFRWRAALAKITVE